MQTIEIFQNFDENTLNFEKGEKKRKVDNKVDSNVDKRNFPKFW